MTLMNRDFLMEQPAHAGEEMRVVFYLRVGAEAPRKLVGAAVSAQLEACREWCERNGSEVAAAGEFR